MNYKKLMNLGVAQATVTMNQDIGGPFGAVVVKNGQVIAVASNSVIGDNDPTAHAEVNAIRKACKNLGTYDLSGCELFATGYPCPMCLSAIIWANIKKVYYCNDVKAAENIGFRDDFIYDFIKGNNKDVQILDLEQYKTEEGSDLYKQYTEMNKVIY